MPKTLSECYEYFNNTLDEKRKKKIKKEGGNCEHFGLGLWIRNNWIYPNKDGKIFGKNICSMKMTYQAQFWMGIIII